MKLKVTADYRNGPRDLAFKKGSQIEVSEEEAYFLLIDSPGSFQEVKAGRPTVKAASKPPADKAVSKPEAKK